MNPDPGLLRSILDRHAQESDFSGVCLVKRGADPIVHAAYGYAHRGFGIPNTVVTRFDTASITKLFTSVAIMQLIEQGLIALDTQVTPYLGRGGTTIPDEVTVFHLLTHTSGIADDADEEAGEEYELLFVDKPNYSIRDTIDLLPQCSCKEPNFPPGTGARYNNCGFVLLGLVIEKASGRPYRDYVREHIFQRAGMSGAEFCAKDGVDSNLAEGYKKVTEDDGGVTWRKNIYSYPPIGTPDGGATVTAMDLDTFLRAVRDGVLLNEKLSRRLLSPQVLVGESGGRTLMNGFGFEFVLSPDGRIVTIAKDGGNPGVAGVLAYAPDHDTTIVLLANQDCNVWAIHRELQAALSLES